MDIVPKGMILLMTITGELHGMRCRMDDPSTWEVMSSFPSKQLAFKDAPKIWETIANRQDDPSFSWTEFTPGRPRAETYILPIKRKRLQIDGHYPCTTYICATYILPHSTHVPLIWMHQLLYNIIYSPCSRCQPPSHPNPHHRGRGIPWIQRVHNHIPPQPTPTGGWGDKNDRGRGGCGRGDPEPGTYTSTLPKTNVVQKTNIKKSGSLLARSCWNSWAGQVPGRCHVGVGMCWWILIFSGTF